MTVNSHSTNVFAPMFILKMKTTTSWNFPVLLLTYCIGMGEAIGEMLPPGVYRIQSAADLSVSYGLRLLIFYWFPVSEAGMLLRSHIILLLPPQFCEFWWNPLLLLLLNRCSLPLTASKSFLADSINSPQSSFPSMTIYRSRNGMCMSHPCVSS